MRKETLLVLFWAMGAMLVLCVGRAIYNHPMDMSQGGLGGHAETGSGGGYAYAPGSAPGEPRHVSVAGFPPGGGVQVGDFQTWICDADGKNCKPFGQFKWETLPPGIWPRPCKDDPKVECWP